MSEALKELRVARTPLPITDLRGGKKTWAVVDSARSILYSEFPVSTYSQKSLNYVYTPPSYDAVIDTGIFLRQPINIKATGTTTGGNMVESGILAPRAFPLSRSMENLNIQFNGNSITIKPSEIFMHLQRYYYTEKDMRVLSTLTPCTLDNCVDYADFNGSINNTLGSAIDQSLNGSPPRGAFAVDASTFVNTTTDYNADYIFTEPLPLSPLALKSSNSWLESGFSRLRGLSFNITWVSDKISSMLSYDSTNSGTTFNTITITLGAPTFLIGSYELNVLDQIPPTLEYDYTLIESNTIDGNNMASGTEVTLSSGNLEFTSIPKWLVVCVTKQDSNLTWADTDAYLNIKNVNCKAGNVSNILSNMSGQQLFNINNKNGNSFFTYTHSGLQEGDYRSPFISGTTNTLLRPVGTPLRFVFGEDITLPKEWMAPAVGEKLQFSISVRVRNQFAGTINSPTLRVIVGYSGIFTIAENGLCDFRTSILSPNDVYNADFMDGITWQSIQPINYGGNFFSNLKKMANKTGRFIKNNKKAIKKGFDKGLDIASLVDPELAPAVQSARMAGLGYGGQIMGRERLQRRLK